MTIAVATTKTGFDSPGDAVASGTETTFANSVDTLFNNVLNGAQAFDKQLFSAAVTLTISAGAVDAPTQVINTIAPETGTSDTLDTIGVSNNRFVILKAATSDTIIISSGVGNITTIDGNSVILTGNSMAMAWCIGSQWAVIGSVGVKNNFASSVTPVTTDDSASGYAEGSEWVNTAIDRAFVNVDATASAAIWKRITPFKNWWRYKAAAATISPIGVALPTIANTPASANGSDGIFITLPTTNVSGNLGGFVTATFNLVRVDHDPVIEWVIKMDATITTLRTWLGIATADVTNSDTAAGSFIGFRFSTVAGDTGWVPVLRDGATQSTGSNIGTVAASTLYKLRIRVDSANARAYFSVNDGTEQLFSTNFPTITTEMGMVCRPITTSAAIRLINFSYAEVGWG